MDEYSDQDTWYELWGHDGFQWEFVADFDTRSSAEVHAQQTDYGYEQMRIKRVKGQM